MLVEQAQRYMPAGLCVGAMEKAIKGAETSTGPEWTKLYAWIDAANLPRSAKERLLPFIDQARTLAAMEAGVAALCGVHDGWAEARRYPPTVLRRVEYAPHRPLRRRKPRAGRRCGGGAMA